MELENLHTNYKFNKFFVFFLFFSILLRLLFINQSKRERERAIDGRPSVGRVREIQRSKLS